VLHRACTKAAAWRTAGCGHFRLMVNISAKEIIDQSILHRIKAVLADTGLEPAALEIELTEWVFMDRSEQTKSLLHELAALHVRLAIDDFGTGYSSLAYLQDIAADTLKIDRRFINNIIDNTRSKHDFAYNGQPRTRADRCPAGQNSTRRRTIRYRKPASLSPVLESPSPPRGCAPTTEPTMSRWT